MWYLIDMHGFISFRKRKGLTQTQVSEILGVSANTVSQWETGLRKPSYEIIHKLLELGATTEELFGIDCSKTCPKSVVAEFVGGLEGSKHREAVDAMRETAQKIFDEQIEAKIRAVLSQDRSKAVG
jgi:transcriptional regulator with XRE-family HTH domain